MIYLVCEADTSAEIWTAILHQHQLESTTLSFHLPLDIDKLTEQQGDLFYVEFDTDKEASLQWCHHLSQLMSGPVLVLTPYPFETELLAFYEVGAADCIARPLSPLLLIAKIKAWLQHSQSFNTITLPLQVNNIMLNASARSLTIDHGEAISLTLSEAKLLQLLMQLPDNVISDERISIALWSTSLDNTTALKNIVYRLRRKIKTVYPEFEAIVWRENGYCFVT